MARSWKLILSLAAILLLQGVGKFLHLQHDHAHPQPGSSTLAVTAGSSEAPVEDCPGHSPAADQQADPAHHGPDPAPPNPEKPGEPHDCDLCQLLGSARADLVALERPAIELPAAVVSPVFESPSRTLAGADPLPRSSRGPPHA